MDVFFFVTIIVIVTTVGGIVRDYLRQRHKAAGEADKQTQTRMEALEERVATLERILTDDKEQLKREIESLSRERA